MTEKQKYKVGDKVLIEHKIIEVNEGEDYPYVTVKGDSNIRNLWTKNHLELFPVNFQPKVTQFVVDWYEKNKEGLYETIVDLIRDDERALYKQANPPTILEEDREFLEWFFREDCAFEILVNMHQFGYEVEKEKRYAVRIKGTAQLLAKRGSSLLFELPNPYDIDGEIYSLTYKELVDTSFEGVFDNPMFEVEEVE